MIPIVNREVREIPIGLIDPPENAMRETFDDDELRELVDDIRVNGVQVALIVEQHGERYRISAGHRRYTAARALGAATLPCDIRQPGELDAEAIKVLENDVRENVNAAEAGAYLMRLYETRAEHDIDKLCAIVRRSRTYIEDRLLLQQGDTDVLAALRQRRISFAVAKELNRVKELGYRRLFLQNAIEGQASAKTVKQWRDGHERLQAAQGEPAPGAGAVEAAAVEPAPSHCACVVCRSVDNMQRMKLVYLHDYCELAVLDRALADFRRSIGGEANG